MTRFDSSKPNVANGPQERRSATVGPWTTNGEYVLNSFGAPVADVYWCENQEENADLIAAAPDMLEVCERVVRDSERGVLTVDTVTLVKAAIAKALGT